MLVKKTSVASTFVPCKSHMQIFKFMVIMHEKIEDRVFYSTVCTVDILKDRELLTVPDLLSLTKNI